MGLNQDSKSWDDLAQQVDAPNTATNDTNAGE